MRILVIDDDSDIRALMTEALSREGHVVTDASDGVEGLQCAREHRPDLILLDLMMPTMDGRAFLQEQRGDPHLADIPVIVVSGYPEDRIGDLETDGYLRKAYDLDEVLEFVSRWDTSLSP